ncbi:hypothetical protein EDD86DRAFT_190388 [Gorgonomyces haynaldii]|nr:hypothetical protein EDD86DRAFT_190388 [Gorgonomyces haynaldii]
MLPVLLASVHSLPHEKPAAQDLGFANIAPKAASKFPTALAYQSLVNSLISQVSETSIKSHIVTLSDFPERYYKSDNGVKAANWLADQVRALNSSVSPDAKLTVSLYQHTWKQPSVIARYEPRVPASNQDLVITGTHFDTLGSGSGKAEPNLNPAVDDCATGSSVIYESLKILVKNNFVPKRPIEIHWYAAEEVGLLGSKAIAQDYAKRGVPVFTYLNLDQAGYVKKGTTETIGIMTDYVTTAATNFMRLTVKAYTSVKNIVDTKCGYACTDNAAWYNAGYNSALAFESSVANATPYNDRVARDGSPLDTLDTISIPHVAQFAKHTIGFLVELSWAGL